MSKVNKVLEAEETIVTIASELKKMKNAAELMDAAQKKVDAVISSSTKIVEETGQFVKEGSRIVEQIGEYNVREDIEKLSDLLRKIDDQTEELNNYISDNYNKVQSIVTESSNDNKEILLGISKQIDEKTDDTIKTFETGSKRANNLITKKYNILTALSLVNLFAIIFAIIKLLGA